jgi:hypothetical protein
MSLYTEQVHQLIFGIRYQIEILFHMSKIEMEDEDWEPIDKLINEELYTMINEKSNGYFTRLN